MILPLLHRNNLSTMLTENILMFFINEPAPQPLFIHFRSFSTFHLKTRDFSRSRAWIIRVKGEHAMSIHFSGSVTI